MQRLASDGSEPAERLSTDQFRADLAKIYVEIEQQVKELGIRF